MNRKIGLVIIILAVIVGVTAYLNQDSIADKKMMEEEVLISIQENGEEVRKFGLEEIEDLGEVTFEKALDTSDSEPVNHTYTGIPLINLINDAGVDLAGKEQVTVKAVDGYIVAMSLEEVRQEDNVYLVYKEDGQYLEGKSEGGSGPLKIVIRKDQFGQRWCKFVIEVNVK